MLVNDEYLFICSGNGFSLRLRHDDLVARLSGQFVKVCLCAFIAGNLFQPAAREVFKTAFNQFKANLIVIVA